MRTDVCRTRACRTAPAAPSTRPTRRKPRITAVVWATALALMTSSAHGAGDATPKYAQLASGARWAGNTMSWSYAPAEQPGWGDADRIAAVIQQAMGIWSAHCGIHFDYLGTTTRPATAEDGANVIGWLPQMASGGNTSWYTQNGVLDETDIQLNVSTNGSATAMLPLVLHELGHAIGLDHSTNADAVMAGPPATPAYSYATALSDDDIAGCQALYGPPMTPVAAQTPPPPVPGGNGGTAAGTATGGTGSLPAADARALEYYHPALDHYFMTADANEQASLANGGPDGQWRATGFSFPVWRSPLPGLEPMCRFYGDWRIDPQTGKRIGPDSHFYTANPQECADVPVRWPVWILEGYAFYAALPDANGSCPAGMQPVYRFFRPQGEPNHRYVTDASVASEMTARGWVPEGVTWCAGA